MHKKIIGIVSFFAVLFLCAPLFLNAQETTADILGRVKDPNGLAVSGAAVSAINKGTSVARDTTSEDSGEFSIRSLPPGVYKVTVSKDGFATSVYESVELLVGQKLNFEVSLRLGASSQMVEVTDETPLIDSTSSEIQGNVSPLEASTLPVIDRNFAGLMTLIAGVRPAENFDPTKTRSGNVSVNGSDGRAVDYNVDGGDNKDNVIGGIVQNYTMEGIQEFNVVTDRYAADSGRAVGAVVNVISKSGTNQVHGTLFGLFQNSGLNAKPAVPPGLEKAKFHRYQYGGSVGAPIVKNKLFIFGAFEQKREPGSIAVDPGAFGELQTLASVFPDLADPVGQLPFPYIDDLVTIKGDWHINDKQNAYIRYGREKWTNPNDQLGSPIVTDLSQSNSDINQFHSLVLSHNWAISQNKINTVSLQFQDFFNGILPSPGRTFTLPTEDGGVATNPEICFKPNPGCGGGSPEVEVGQNVNVPQSTFIRKYQIREDFGLIKGKHSMKFGANYIYLAKLGGSFFFGANGYQVTFWDDPSVILANTDGTYPQGLSTPGAVQELTFSTGSGSTAQPPAHSIGLYFQDDYKVTPHLTLNLGLRWDANPKFLVPQLTNNPDTTNRAIAALREILAANITDPAAADGVAVAQDLAGKTGPLTRNTASWKEFQPRFGFAWDPTGSGRFVVRGGYGVARDQIFQNLTLFAIQESNPTLYQTALDLTANGTGNLCVPTAGGTPATDLCQFRFGVDPLPSPVGFSPTELVAGGTGRIIDPRLDDPWSQQMSIGGAWQWTKDFAVSADYYHVIGNHEPRVLQQNPVLKTLCDPAFPGSDPVDPRCVNGANTRLLDAAFLDAGLGIGRLGELRDYSTNTRSFYDGINLSLKRRFSHNFQFVVTDVISWARGWGGQPTASYGGSGLNITPDREFLPGEFGPTNFDERNRFSASGVFQLPHGFEIAPIFQASTGRPYTALAGQDLDGDGRSTIDRACVDGSATPGCTEVHPNTFRGKAYIQLDLHTAYVFNIRENMKFRIIWEMFNIGNRANSCNNVDTNFYNGTFGVPNGYCGGQGPGSTFGGPYRSQFGFRFEF